MTALPHFPRMGVEQYFQLEESAQDQRYEYIDGLVTMMAGGTLDHATISANVISLLRGALRGSPCRTFTSDARVRLSETRFVYPDVTVSCDERDRGQVKTLVAPRLVVEVLSPATEGYDRGRKFAYYRDCHSIQVYVLIDTLRPTVDVYQRGRNELWILRTYDGQDVVVLPELNVQLPLSAIYEDIVFPPDNENFLA